MPRKKITRRILVPVALAVLGLVSIFLVPAIVDAFNGPSSAAGVGYGALKTDTQNNIGINASADSVTKLLIKASSTSASEYSLKVVQQDGATPPSLSKK